MASRPFCVLQENEVLRRPWLTVRAQRVLSSTGVEIPEYHLLDAPDWAAMVVVTAQDEIVLVRQYRHGVGGETLELPAGALDEGEEPLTAAKRELLEETGYEAPEWHLLRTLSPEPCRHTHRAHLFLALGATRRAAQTLDATEALSVELWPRSEPGIVDALSHGVHLGAWLLAQRWLDRER